MKKDRCTFLLRTVPPKIDPETGIQGVSSKTPSGVVESLSPLIPTLLALGRQQAIDDAR